MSVPPVPQLNGLRWWQPQVEPGYHELRDGEGNVHVTLRFAPRPTVAWAYTDARRARSESGSLKWNFQIERSGFMGLLGLRASVVIDGTANVIFHAGSYFITGDLALPSGRTLAWNGGAARSASAFVDERREPVMTFNPGSIAERVNAYVEFDRALVSATEWPLLAGLGLYLRLAMNKVFK